MKPFIPFIMVLLTALAPCLAETNSLEGKWKWEIRSPGGNIFDEKARFELEGEKIKGSMNVRGMPAPLLDGTFKDGKVSFRVERKFNNRSVTNWYEGNFDGKRILGKMRRNFGGEEVSIDWKAEPDIPTVNGKWKWSVLTSSGQSYDTVLEAKQEGSNFTGVVVGRSGAEWPVKNGKMEGDKISFEVVRERDGTPFVFSYSGKLNEDVITGTQEWKWPGDTRTKDWEARKVR